MKKIQSKSLLTLVIILIVIGISTTSATRFIGKQFKSGFISGSTTELIVLGDSAVVPLGYNLIENPKRIYYPALLREHRHESKRYIAKYLKSHRGYIKLMFRRGKDYMPAAREIFDQYDVPHEFAVLPALESNFVGHAVSSAGAVGYWQLMPNLARTYGLKIGGANDERKSFQKSTHAAARFIHDQLEIYNNNPLLVVAAYNSGPGRVNYAIKKSGSTDYWSLDQFLPEETRRFVLRFLALNVVVENFDKFLTDNIDLEEPATIQLAEYDSVRFTPVPRI